jgi:endoglucanase
MAPTRTLLGTAALAAALLMTASCGGGGGGGGGGPAPTPAPTPAPVPTPTASGAALTQVDARIGACLNMGNHLEPPNEGDWGRAINSTDFAEIKARGFETVRLPVRFSNHAATAAPYTIDAAFMNRVEQVVDLARASGLRVILDLHHYEDPQGNIFTSPAAQAPRLAGLWKQIADRFKNKDQMVWFEILNEPHDQLTHANLLSVLQPALNEIRATNPSRPVVIGGEFWSNITTLDDIPLPANDQRLIVTFHYYDPFDFTHQGATWITPTPPLGRIFPSGTDLADLNANVQLARDFMTRTGRPLFLGEYGANEAIALDQRATWYKTVHDAFAAANVDGCVWAYTNTFPFRDPVSNGWYTQLLDAIGL